MCIPVLAFQCSLTHLKRDLIKIQPVAHVIVCANRFGIVVNHYGLVTHLKQEKKNISITVFTELIRVC